MRICEWNRLKPGMRTAKQVVGKDRLLLPAGAVLSRQTIERLPIWGIFHVMVETAGEHRLNFLNLAQS